MSSTQPENIEITLLVQNEEKSKSQLGKMFASSNEVATMMEEKKITWEGKQREIIRCPMVEPKDNKWFWIIEVSNQET